MTNTERIQANNADLRECINIAENLPDAETSVEVVLQRKTVTPSKSAQEITADADYTALEKVTVEAIPSEYIIPSGTKSITENGEHDIKAYEKATVNVPIPDGYIQPSGTLEVTENGTYDVTDKVLVNVNVATSGGGDTEDELAQLLMNKLTVLDNSNVTSLRTRACQAATVLKTVNLPAATSIGTYAFYGCSSLLTVNLPLATSVPNSCFYTCAKLTKADLGAAKSIAGYGFYSASGLTALILRRSDAICALSATTSLTSSGIALKKGYVYVPAALIEEYKTATNWTTYADQFRAIEDYPEICGG